MKLFVWDEVLTDWTSGIMFAMANTREEAEALLLAENSYLKDELANNEPVVYDNEPMSRILFGGG